MPRMCILLATVLIAGTAAAKADIYKCVDQYGRPSFSDKYCVGNAQLVILNVPQASGVQLGSTGDFSEIAAENEVRDVVRRVTAMQRKLQSLQRDYQTNLSTLDQRLIGVPNSPRGERERVLLQAKLDSLRNVYEGDKRHAIEKLKALRSMQSKLH